MINDLQESESEHIVALDSVKLQASEIDNISPSSSPPTKGPKLGCVQCGRHFKEIKDLEIHVRYHERWKLIIVKTPHPVLKQVKDYDEGLMSNDAGIEDESKCNLEEVVDTVSPDPGVPPFFWVQTPRPVPYEGGGLVTRTPQAKHYGGSDRMDAILLIQRQNGT